MNRFGRFIEHGIIIQKVYIPSMLLLLKSQNTARREWEYESK